MAIWIHWSDRPIEAVRSVEQNNARIDKPTGLWLSDESDEGSWSEWCRSENFHLDRLTVEHEINLAAKASILRVSSVEELDDFNALYDIQYPWTRNRPGNDGIDWIRVSKEYDGILITPYLWSQRLTEKYRWYYSWDCASGCIWNNSVIASIRVVATHPIMEVAE